MRCRKRLAETMTRCGDGADFTQAKRSPTHGHGYNPQTLSPMLKLSSEPILSSWWRKYILFDKSKPFLTGVGASLEVRVFANRPGDLGSIPGRVIPKTQKMVLDAPLLNIQHYKVRIKGKVEQSRKGVAPSPTPWCSSYRKGSLRVTLDNGRQLYLLIVLPVALSLTLFKHPNLVCDRFSHLLQEFSWLTRCCRSHSRVPGSLLVDGDHFITVIC